MLNLGIEPAKAATYQEQLDMGYVEWEGGGDQTIILKKNEIYYIGLRGATGGAGGTAVNYTTHSQTGEWGWYYGYRTGQTPPSKGELKVYKVTVGNSDVSIKVSFGSEGGRGYQYPDSYSWPPPGGAGGSPNGQPGKSVSDDWAGGGGGGGGASRILFHGNSSYVLSASGGKGGKGADCWNEKKKEYRAYGGQGGAGGVVANTTNIPGIGWVEVIEAEGSLQGVNVRESCSVAIRKYVELGDGEIAFSDLPYGSYIVLENYQGRATIFRKTGEYEVGYESGNANIYTYTTGSASWYDFTDYAISGNGSGSTLKLTLKEDLTVIGGDGTSERPFYVVKAGEGGSGGKTIDYRSDYDIIAKSLLFLGEKQGDSASSMESQTEQIEKQTLALERLVENTLSLNKPTIKKFSVANGASIVSRSNVQLSLAVEGYREGSDLQMSFRVNSGGWTPYTDYDTSYTLNKILDVGYNTIHVRVQDAKGNIDEDNLQVFAR